MQNTDVYALQRSELNGFLFADVGTEANGMTLSVLSALSRLGMDPWQEASRLAKLPRSTAIDGLARLISSMPGSLWPMPDATPIATRLIGLLPSGGSAPPPSPAMTRTNAGGTLAARLTAMMQAGRARPSLKPGDMVPRSTRQWTIVLVLLAAVLVALVLNMTGHRMNFFDNGPAATTTTTTLAPAAK